MKKIENRGRVGRLQNEGQIVNNSKLIIELTFGKNQSVVTVLICRTQSCVLEDSYRGLMVRS